MRYFLYEWTEDRGDEFSDWGNITFLTEIAEDNYASRQIEIYENGNVLKYDLENLVDYYGMLSEKEIEIGDESIEISAEEFEEKWNKLKAINQE